MDSRQDRSASRREELEELVPGSGIGAEIDRGAWMALSQGAPGTWSWRRAGTTFGVAAVLVAILYAAVDSSIDWVIGIALAYALLFWRARTVHAAYLNRTE
jgi:hypothetical protein